MSTPCTNCKDSILNKTPTLIGSPLCNGDCPEEYVCLDITPAGCVSIQGKDDCITNGDTVQEQIDNIRDYVCELVPPTFPDIYVKVNSSDTTSGYLMTKFSQGDVIPVLDNTIPTAPKIKFVRQIKTYSTVHQSIPNNPLSCNNYYSGGVDINTPWTTEVDTFIDSSDISLVGTTFRLKKGIYNVSIHSILSSSTPFSSAPGFVQTQFKKVGSDVYAIARGVIVCSEETVSLASGASNGITLNTTTDFVVNIFNKTGNTLYSIHDYTAISFEKVGVV